MRLQGKKSETIGIVRKASNMVVYLIFMENITSIFSQGITHCIVKTTENNTVDSSRQALMNFSFTEFFTTDFLQNKFSKFHQVISHYDI